MKLKDAPQLNKNSSIQISQIKLGYLSVIDAICQVTKQNVDNSNSRKVSRFCKNLIISKLLQYVVYKVTKKIG